MVLKFHKIMLRDPPFLLGVLFFLLLGEFLGAAHLGTYYTIGIVLAWMCSSNAFGACIRAPHDHTNLGAGPRQKISRFFQCPARLAHGRGFIFISTPAADRPMGQRGHPNTTFRATSHEYRQTSVNKMLRFGCKGAIKVVLSAITSWE